MDKKYLFIIFIILAVLVFIFGVTVSIIEQSPICAFFSVAISILIFELAFIIDKLYKN